MAKLNFVLVLFCLRLQFCSLTVSAPRDAKVSSSKSPMSVSPKDGRDSLRHEKPFLFPVLVRGLGMFAEDDIKELFADCGDVKSVHRSGTNKWFVYFADKSSAALGQRLNGTDFEVITSCWDRTWLS